MIKVTDETKEFLKMGMKITSKSGREFYFLPFYFEDMGDNLFEQYNLEFLPEELKESIELNRNLTITNEEK